MRFRLVLVAAIGAPLVAGALSMRLWPELLEQDKPKPPELPNPPVLAATGELSPIMNLQDLDGSWHSVGGPAESPTLIYFWASWCAPCLRALPKLDASQSELQAAGVSFLSVAQDERSMARSVLSKIPVSFPVLVAEGASGDPVKAMGSRDGFVPYSVLINEEGRVLMQIAGEVPLDEVLAVVAQQDVPAL